MHYTTIFFLRKSAIFECIIPNTWIGLANGRCYKFHIAMHIGCASIFWKSLWASLLWHRVVHFMRKNLRLRGRPPPIICARLDRPVNALQLCHWKFSHKESFFEKSPIFIRKRSLRFEPPLRLRGNSYGVHLRLIGKLVVDFLLVIIKATPTRGLYILPLNFF